MLGSSPSGFWTLDEAQGSTRLDSVGSGRFLENTSMPASTVRKFGDRSAGSNWQSSYLRQQSLTDIHPTGSFSWAFWFRFPSANHQQAYFPCKRTEAGSVNWQIDHLDTTNAPERLRFLLRNSANSATTIVQSGLVPVLGQLKLCLDYFVS